MLTLPSTWDEALHRPVKATWLIQLYYDSTNYVGLSFEDIDYLGTPYYGAVLNKPSIRDAMNLAESKASTSNISLSVANFKYNGADFSEELFGGTNKYINKDCKIYLYLEDAPADTWDTLTTNWEDEDRDWDAIGVVLQIYQGRIEKMSHTADKINISIKAKRPWDFISIPNTTATTSKRYKPVAYGGFTPNTSTSASPDYSTGKTLFPMPVDRVQHITMMSLAPRDNSADGTPDGRLHYYDENLDRFFPVTSTSGSVFDNDTEVYDSDNVLTNYYTIRRSFKFKPEATTNAGGWTSAANAYDTPTADDTSTEATVTLEITDGTTTGAGTYYDTETIKLKLPQIDGKVTSIKWEITTEADWTRTGAEAAALTVNWNNVSYSQAGSTSPADTIRTNNTISGSSGTFSESSDQSADMITLYKANSGLQDIEIEGELKLVATGASASATASMKLKDVRCLVDVEVALDNDNIQSGMDFISKIKHLYSGMDGISKSYSGGSGAATTIQEAHRDILKRYAGVDDSDGNITGWSALDTARSGWNIRYWLLEPEDLGDVLNKLQKEGAFVFMYRPDGTMRYWYLPNKSGTSADHTLTKHDVSDLSISHTDFSSLITKWELHSERHPAEDRHMTSATLTNSSARTDWNIQTEENTKEVKLDALVANVSSSADPSSDNTNDNWAGYYDGILGDVGILVSGKAFGKFAVTMEIGDVVEFSDAPTSKFFGESYSGKIFVITKTQKTTDAASFTAVEIRK
jgi:hypothetical protein